MNIAAEFRSVMRGLARRPGYAIASIVMLALALTANGVVFGVIYGFLLRPLPFAAPQRLVGVTESYAALGRSPIPGASYRLYHALREHPADTAGVGVAEHGDTAPVEINGTTRALFYNEVTPSAFRTVGTKPVIGRLPSAQTGKPGGAGEAVLAYGLWQSAFGGSPSAIGQRVKVSGTSYRIVGVMPRRFFLPYGGFQMWVTEAVTPAMLKNTGANRFLMARLAPGASLAAFNARLESVRARLLRGMTPSERSEAVKQGYTIRAFPLGPRLRAYFGGGSTIWWLQAAALLLLFLALANTVNLTLVRQQDRLPELATRYAVGASRAVLLRHAATEAIAIVVVAGGLALLLAWAGIGGINGFAIIPQFSPLYVAFGAPVIICVLVLMLISALCLAAAASGVARTRRLLATIGHGPGAAHGRGVAIIQRTLTGVQTALACALLIASFLLGMSLWNLFTRPLGFQPQGRVAMQVFLPQQTDPATAWRELAPALAALPEVKSAAASGQIPYSNYGEDFSDISATDGKSVGDHPPNVRVVTATDTFFHTLAIPLLHGQFFGKTGAAGNHGVVVSAALAKRLFGTTNAVGHTVGMGSSQLRIVGVVQNVSWQATPSRNIAGVVYFPVGPVTYAGFVDVSARIRGSAAAAIPIIERTIKQAVPGSAVYQTHTMQNLVRNGLALRSVAAGLVGSFAIIALILAALGVFAVTSFIVRRRLAEYGIRAALGATPRRLLFTGVRDIARALVPGLVVGLVCAWLLYHAMGAFLYQVSAAAIPLFVIGVALIVAATATAAFVPLARAARVPIRNLIGGGGAQ
ncbi:MAG: ABC transporter permease [Gammaproteobacteria bacterium]